MAGARVLFRGGVPIATSVRGQMETLVALDPAELAVVRRALSLDPAWRFLREPA